MISQKIQIAYHLDDQIRQITDLQNLSYVHKISKYDVNGNLVSWTSQLNSNTHVLQGFTTIEPNTAYIVESNSTAVFPYSLFPDADNVVHDSDLLATSGHLETSLIAEMVVRDSLERDFSEAVFRDLLTASGDLNTSIIDTSGVLDTRIDSVENSLDARLDIVEHHFEVTAIEGKYVFNGNGCDNRENPALYLSKGETYYFTINAKGHPFYIKSVPGIGDANAYSPGMVNNGIDEGLIIFTIPQDASDVLYYNCQFHETMAGEIRTNSGGGTGEGGSAGRGLVSRGGEIDLENPKADFSPLVSGVFAPEEKAANHLAREDLLTIFDQSDSKFKYTTLEDMINATYINLYDNDLRPEYIDGGGADEFGPFGNPNGGGGVGTTGAPVGNRPSITIFSDVTSVSAGETAYIQFNLSEAASGNGAPLFEASDINVTNGSISNFASSESTGVLFSALFTPTENLELTQAIITVPAGSFLNSSGLSNTASELRINVETIPTVTTPAVEPPKTYSYELSVGPSAYPGGLQARTIGDYADITTSISHNVNDLSNLLLVNVNQFFIYVLEAGQEKPAIMVSYDSSHFNTSTKKEIKITIAEDSWDIVLDLDADTDPNIYYTSSIAGMPVFVLVK